MIARRSCKALAVLVLLVSVLSLMPRRTQACGPFFTDAIFVFTKHPDFPLERFAGGQIGILRPSYARSYLVAAYRILIGRSLSAKETTGLKSLWEDRLSYGWEFHDEDWIKQWANARSKVPGAGAPLQIRAFRNREKPHEYESYLNCQQDAFVNAEATLNERIKQFGADSTVVREWLVVQDTVFSNCGEGRQIPEPARPDQEPLIRADRAYQIAAANFYAGSFDEAKQQFDAIARDKSSPWREWAGYLAARALLRKGSFAEKQADGRPALAEAETRLNAILKDKSVATTHHSAARLLNLTRLRLHPEEKVHELAQAIIKKDSSDDFKQTVWDYTVLLDKFLGEEAEVSSAALPPELKDDELSDWIVTFQDESAEAWRHSIAQWEKTRSVPWLVVAMTKANGQHAKVEILLSAASKVDHSSPAFPSLTYHIVRLLIESKREAEARNTLDKILATDRARMTPSAVNLLLGQRMILAQNLNEFLQNAQRVPAGFSDDVDGREIPEEETEARETAKGKEILFESEGANILNMGVPAAIMKDAARSTILAPNLRRDVAQAALLRAALIDDRESAIQAGTVLATIQPDLKNLIAAYGRAQTPDARQFAAAFLALNFPGLRPFVSAGIGRTTAVGEIDSYRDNWWCTEPPSSLSGAGSEGEAGSSEKAKARLTLPEFLKPSQTLAAKQFATLQALGTAPNYLCRTAIEWTNRNPSDPRAPEALHLAVKSTRYGCTDKETGRWSKAAFDLLHRLYPTSSWAKETKYWFKG